MCSLSADTAINFGQADCYISVAISPKYLGMAQAVNFRPNMRAGFDPKPIHVEFVVDKMEMGQVWGREILTAS
jgi:hypothetical protein